MNSILWENRVNINIQPGNIRLYKIQVACNIRNSVSQFETCDLSYQGNVYFCCILLNPVFDNIELNL